MKRNAEQIKLYVNALQAGDAVLTEHGYKRVEDDFTVEGAAIKTEDGAPIIHKYTSGEYLIPVAMDNEVREGDRLLDLNSRYSSYGEVYKVKKKRRDLYYEKDGREVKVRWIKSSSMVLIPKF